MTIKKKSIFTRIKDWNEPRGLIKTPNEFDLENETSFIVEELLEATSDIESAKARILARKLNKRIHQESLWKRILVFMDFADEPEVFTVSDETQAERVVDAMGDIIVFATGAIIKLGYNPDIVMEEVLKEIESRVGKEIDGKFTKDKSPEAQEKWYKADFKLAK